MHRMENKELVMGLLENIRRLICERCCWFLCLFSRSKFLNIYRVSCSEERIECLLEKKPYIGGIEFLVIEIVVGMNDNRFPFFAIG